MIANVVQTQCPVLRIEPHMLQVPFHRLGNPIVQYAQGRTAHANEDTGRWNLGQLSFLRNSARVQFNYVFLVPRLAAGDSTVANYTSEFANQLTRCGVGIPREGPRIDLANLSEATLQMALQTASARTPRPNVVILLLRAKNIPVYSMFKYLTDRVYGLQSICMTEEKCLVSSSLGRRGPAQYKGLPQYMGNIAMKANLKTGGVNHASTMVQAAAAKTLVLGVRDFSMIVTALG